MFLFLGLENRNPFWYFDFLVRWEKLSWEVKNEQFPNSLCINSWVDQGRKTITYTSSEPCKTTIGIQTSWGSAAYWKAKYEKLAMLQRKPHEISIEEIPGLPQTRK